MGRRAKDKRNYRIVLEEHGTKPAENIREEPEDLPCGAVQNMPEPECAGIRGAIRTKAAGSIPKGLCKYD
jgi:hypothetical protein